MTYKSASHAFFAIPILVAIASCSGDPQLKLGEEVFGGLCINCHALGINGAPIVGNERMWGPRIEQGLPTLIEHATNGYGQMPLKGGNPDLTDEEVAAAVTYMVSQIEQ